MPNIDFERKALAARLAKTMHAPDFTSRLLGIKTKLDYEDEELIRLNFLDTFRPELWCLEGLARHLEPVPGRHYGLELVEKLPHIPAHFAKIPQGKQTWILYVEVGTQQEIVDDGYFLKKVREQIGFGNYQNIDVTVMPGMQQNIAVTIAEDDSGETVPSMTLETSNILLIPLASCPELNDFAPYCKSSITRYITTPRPGHGISPHLFFALIFSTLSIF